MMSDTKNNRNHKLNIRMSSASIILGFRLWFWLNWGVFWFLFVRIELRLGMVGV